MNSAQMSGVVIEVMSQSGTGSRKATRFSILNGEKKAKKKNTQVHFVNMAQITAPDYSLTDVGTIQEGMYVEVLGRIQGIITEHPNGQTSFSHEFVATKVSRSVLREDSLTAVGESLPMQVEPEPDRLEI